MSYKAWLHNGSSYNRWEVRKKLFPASAVARVVFAYAGIGKKLFDTLLLRAGHLYGSKVEILQIKIFKTFVKFSYAIVPKNKSVQWHGGHFGG